MSSEIMFIKILMLNLRGLALGLPSYAHFLKLVLSGRALPLYHEMPLASLIRYLDQGDFL